MFTLLGVLIVCVWWVGGGSRTASETLMIMFHDIKDSVTHAVADGVRRASRVHEVEQHIRRARLLLEHKESEPGESVADERAALRARPELPPAIKSMSADLIHPGPVAGTD
jgi:hypothetical protein